ncbi:MAG: tetratricopeptide repeat protein [Candidatus Handelsmanbacteria bacterium]|nr:tetratricopeptide repeat protein [Candidatus Handelsmanbacteria bacterium]
MNGLLALIGVLSLVGSTLTRFSPTVEEIKSRFDLGQKYYAAKDYDNGVKVFKEISDTPNQPLLRVDSITVLIDELLLPIRMAATYQVGNSFRNVGLDLLTRSSLAREEGDSLLSDQRRQEAVAALRSAQEHFGRISADALAPQRVRVMSQYQNVRVHYAREDYAGVVAQVDTLQRRFPGSEFEEAALYDLGWAYFQMGEYRQGIEAFARVRRLSGDAVRVDRSIFQTAEAHEALGEPELAVGQYQALVDKYDFAKLSAKDQEGKEAAKLRGVVEETRRELVAKAQLKIGDIHAGQGEVDLAIAAYSLVPQRYPQEQFLVEQAHTRMAELVLERRGLDEGIRAYEQGVLSVDRKEFQATARLQIARLYFEAGRYPQAIEAYRVYDKGYGDVARQVGFTRDKVLFKVAEAFRELGRQSLEQHQEPAARESFGAALAHYDSLLSWRAGSPLAPDTRFGRGLCQQGLGQSAEALALYEEVVHLYPAHPAAPNALLQIARLQYQGGEGEEAVGTYKQLLASYPQAPFADEVYIELGVAHKSMGQVDPALAAFRQVSRQSPRWVKVQVEIGDLLTSAGRYAEAQEALDEAVALAGDDAETLASLRYIKGKIAYSQKQYPQAIALLGEAIAGAGDSQIITSGQFLRGLAHYELSRQQDGNGNSMEGTRHAEAAALDLRQTLETDLAAKMKNVAYRTLGTTMSRLGRSVETIRYYRELIGATPEVQERVGLQLLLLEIYYDQRLFDEAVDAAGQLIGESFADSDEMGYFLKERAYSILSSVELEREHYSQALAAAQGGLARFPRSGESASMAFVIGLAPYLQEEYAEAALGFARYVEQYSEDRRAAEGCYYAGLSHQILGEFAAAAGWFRRLADRFADSPLAAEALFLAGENLYNSLQFQQAYDTQAELLRRYPNNEYADDAHYSAAWALFELKRLEEGIGQMRQLVSRFPDSPHAPRAQYTIGDLYYSEKYYQPAQEAYRQVVALFPHSPEAARAKPLVGELEEQRANLLYEEAVVKYQQSEYVEAIRLYGAVAEQFPGTYSAYAALGNMGVALEQVGDVRRAAQTYREVIAQVGADSTYQEVLEFARARLKHL